MTVVERAERMGTLAEDPASAQLRRSRLQALLRRLWKSKAEPSMMLQSRRRRFTEIRALKMKRPTFPRRIVLPESRISTALPSPTREMSR